MSSYHNCFILAKQTKQRYRDLMSTLCKQRSPYLQSQNYKAKPSACPISILIETPKEFLRNDMSPADQNNLCRQRTKDIF